MRRPQRLLLTASVALALHATPRSVDAATPAPSSTLAVADGMTQLGFDLFAKLAAGDSNVVTSPLSIDQALALLYNGARGETQRKCAAVMGLTDLSMPQANHGFAALRKSLITTDPAVQFDIANAIWPDHREKLNAQYAERCRQYLSATVEPLDYHNPTVAASKINGWVDKHTHHNIPTLVDASVVKDASVVLTNAIYFHGKWTTPFNKAATVAGKFQTPNGSKKVPMMGRLGSMDYVGDATYQAVSLPYGNGNLRMMVAIPRSGNDIASLVSQSWWNDVVDRVKPSEVGLSMPRFKASFSADLTQPLQTLGLPKMGDYTGIATGGLGISAIIHKATIDVDEDGTVASAATGIVMTRSIRADIETMTVDRPFFFAIYDLQTKAVLFTGVIRDPAES